MADQPHLLLFGASVRAAALSALRAGLRPWCADLFADRDLRAWCPALAVPSEDYPKGFLKLLAQAPQGPWMYTGGLENHPALVEALSRQRPLWGNGADVLRRVRAPARVTACLRKAGIARPEVRLRFEEVPKGRRWLVKPLDGTGGRGIGFVEDGVVLKRRLQIYFQEFIEGEPCSAVYIGWEHPSEGSLSRASFLGATRQLIGEPWLHAAPFHYCGSVGPLELSLARQQHFVRLGTALAEAFQLRGLFGVDCVLRDGVPWPVEVNPRYPASVEVLEVPDQLSAVALHRAAFEPSMIPRSWVPNAAQPPARTTIRGKAILFARDSVVFPGHALGMDLKQDSPIPIFADIPPAGQSIEQGRPILTLFAEAATVDECQAQLQERAAHLDRCLFGR